VQRVLITIGLVLLVLGLAWPLLQKLGLGRLPGDVSIEGEKFRFYFPLTTSIIISIILTLIFWLFRK
jgi:ribose/xylose/arabinose/galactoside ABC-type transport system permease subunit